jgi:5-methyltetrahydropteroyltriglutamate--homocysteine methyltransferase
MDWTFNEYYERKQRDIKNFASRRRSARRNLILDLIEEALRPEFKKLVEAGAKWIQIDEPAVTTKEDPEEMELFVEAYNRLTEGFDAEFSLHNCFSNYDLLAEYVPRLRDCSQLSLEFANRDVHELGDARPGYYGLTAFLDNGYRGSYAPGFIDVHTDLVESPELIRDRVLYVADIVGKEKVWVSPDCGLRTRSWEVAYEKLCNMTKGASLARDLV